MNLSLIAPSVDHRPAAVHEPSASLEEYDPSIHRVPPESIRAIASGGAALQPAPPPHRRHAAALIRQLGGRTESVLRRELARFFAARPDLSHADRAAIARAMSRYRNQVLHHPRSTLRAVATSDIPSGLHPLLDAVRRLFGLAEVVHADEVAPITSADFVTK